jgi:hypothetical protein
LCLYRNYDYVRRQYFGMSLAGSLARLLKRIIECLYEGDYVILRIKWTLKYYIDSFRPEFTSLSPAEWKKILGAAQERQSGNSVPRHPSATPGAGK